MDDPRCEYCNEPFPPRQPTGRRRRYCPRPRTCRDAAYRERLLAKAASWRRKTGITDADGQVHCIAAYLAIEAGNVSEILTA